MDKNEYTFTFDKDDERQFRQIMSRLDLDEFTVSKDISPVNADDPLYSDLSTVMEMEPGAASMFRLGMKHVIIRRTRTEEELAEEKAKKEANTIVVKVYTGGPTP